MKGLESTLWKGRFEVVSDRPLTIIDGAHNEDGIKVLIESIRTLPKPLIVLFAALKDKETESMTRKLQEVADQLIVSEFDFYRAQSAQNLKINNQIMAIEDFKEAIKIGQQLAQDGTLIITGSLYFISEVRHEFSVD